MIITRFVRCFSTRTFVDQWVSLKTSSSLSHREQWESTARQIEELHKIHSGNSFHLFKEIIGHYETNHGTQIALYICHQDHEHLERYTFDELSKRTAKITEWFTTAEINLTKSSNILVDLPSTNVIFSCLQLACAKSGIVFHSIGNEIFKENLLREKLRKSAVDCIISVPEHIELINRVTYNSLRPLKKILITNESKNEPFPFGWQPFTLEKSNKIHSTESIKQMRHLSNKALSISDYLHPNFFIAYWLSLQKIPRLIWIKDRPDRMALASWLMGTTIFYRDANDSETIMKTLKDFPIDTFCASKQDYQLVSDHDGSVPNQLEQLLATEQIDDSDIREHWREMTDLEIHDDLMDENTDPNLYSSWMHSLVELRQKRLMTRSNIAQNRLRANVVQQ